MAEGSYKRKLAAVFSADVVGYSRLMGEDETATVRILEVYKGVMSELIRQHRGRVVDSPGDNVLAEFASVVDAVQCAVAVQKELQARNADLPDNRRMEFRIGINLGDVIEEQDRIYGDGVNIAARLEALAPPGGICVSKTAFDQIETKLPLGYEYIGEQTVKNIARPVGAYRVMLEPRVTVAGAPEKKARPVGRRGMAWAAGALVVVAAAVVLMWPIIFPPSPPPPPQPPAAQPPPPVEEKADPKKMAFPLPDLPSIAVMAFVNMSGDPHQDFFSDGITEEITTALSKVPHLFVISRQSSFSYKGKPVKLKQVSEELGVRYVLEGSVQRSGDRIRINAQLIDALTGRHIWAERYERELKDLFALQDEITLKILTAIRVKLADGEQASSLEKYFRGKQGLDCYLKLMEARNYLRGHNINDTKVARRMTEEAMAMCPENPLVYLTMGGVHQMEYWVGAGKSPRESTEKGIEMIQKALAMDDSIAAAHAVLGHLYLQKREYDKAIAEAERAVALDPGSEGTNNVYATLLYYGARLEEAIPVFQKAIRLNPFGSTSTFLHLGHTYRVMGRFDEAVSAYKKALQLAPDNIFAHLGLVTAYMMMGREEEARAEAAEVLRINPKFSLDSYAKIVMNKDQSVVDNAMASWRKAGLK